MCVTFFNFYDNFLHTPWSKFGPRVINVDPDPKPWLKDEEYTWRALKRAHETPKMQRRHFAFPSKNMHLVRCVVIKRSNSLGSHLTTSSNNVQNKSKVTTHNCCMRSNSVKHFIFYILKALAILPTIL